MSKPIHTPGPARVQGCTVYALNDVGTNRFTANVQSGKAESARTTDEECAANARLLAAAYNAFDSAGKALGCNAVELAERMQEGALAELIKCLEQMTEFYVDDYSDRETSEPVQRARAIIAKVKGGAT